MEFGSMHEWENASNESQQPGQMEPIENTICGSLNSFYDFHVNPIINVMGFTLNIVCAFVYNRLIRAKKKRKDDMLLYLFLKSMVDSYLSVRNLLFYIIDDDSYQMHRFFSIRFIELFFIVYFGFIAQFMSLAFELLANFDRFRKITQCLLIFNKVPCQVVIGVVAVYSSCFYIYKFYEYNFQLDTDLMVYKINLTSFGNSATVRILGLIHSVVRDCLFVLVLVSLNILTVIKMKQAFKNNRMLTRRNRNQRIAKTKCFIRKEKVEQQITIMLLLTSTVAVIGHGFFFINYLPISQQTANSCIYFVGNLSFDMSYTANFFFYLFLNKHFRYSLLTSSRCCQSATSNNNNTRNVANTKYTNRHDASISLRPVSHLV